MTPETHLKEASPANVIKYLSQPGRILSSRERSRFRRWEYSSSVDSYADISICRLHNRITGAKAVVALSVFGIARGFVVKVRCESSGDGGGGMVNEDAVVPFGICNV